MNYHSDELLLKNHVGQAEISSYVNSVKHYCVCFTAFQGGLCPPSYTLPPERSTPLRTLVDGGFAAFIYYYLFNSTIFPNKFIVFMLKMNFFTNREKFEKISVLLLIYPPFWCIIKSVFVIVLHDCFRQYKKGGIL